MALSIPESARVTKVDKRLVEIARQAAASFPYEVRVTPHGGANRRRSGTPNHPHGYALDFQIQDPTTGEWLDNYKNPQTFRVYEQYAQTMRQVQLQQYPELTGDFRFGGYFGGRFGYDQMHIDINPNMNGAMSMGSWEGGLGRNADGTPILDDKGNPIKLGRMARAESVGMGQGPVELSRTAQSAIASLQPPSGGTQAPTPPSPLQGFAPTIPDAAFGSPGQAAISDLISPPSTVSDVDKLAGVMLAEGRGEGREGKIGIGNVVLNRKNAAGNRFPKTIDGVINNEFAKPLGPNDVSPDEWVETRSLATELLNGTIPDNTGGAVYFANTATASPNAYAEIAASGPVSTTIGNHTYHVDTGIGPVVRGTGAIPAAPFISPVRGRQEVPGALPATPPPIRGPGPGGALGVDLGMQPAGMPVPPSRPGAFDWLGGGAPDAGVVPTPGISPLRPQIGGPGDRRPQPPLPQMRPAGPQSPASAFSAPAGPSDLIPYSTRPPATAAPPIPGLDRSLLAGGNLGTPETAMSLERTFPPLSPAPPNLMPSEPPILDPERFPSFSPSRKLADELNLYRRDMEGYTTPVVSEPAWSDPSRTFDIPPPLSRMADAPPPVRPTITPDFDFATAPGPTFTPPSLAPDIRGRPGFPGSMPPAPPLQSMVAGRQEFPGFLPPAPAIEPVSAAPPDYDPLSSAPPRVFDDETFAPTPGPTAVPSPASWGDMSNIPGRFDDAFGPTQPTTGTGENIVLPGSQAGASGVLPEDEPAPYITPYAQQDPVRDPAATAAVAATVAPAPDQRPGFFPTLGSILGIGGGGSIFGIGPNGFLSNAGSFTPFTGAGAGGSSPFNQQPGGAMGTTTWRHGSVTGNPNMQGTMWNRSGNNGSVGYVTDPVTGFGHPIYSGSPNRF